MSLKKVEIKVKDMRGTIGNRWKGGETILILKPGDPATLGNWDSDRSIDIGMGAGTDHATYVWNRLTEFLFVQVGNYQGDTSTKIPLTLFNFSGMKQGVRGKGSFDFRGIGHPVSWEIISLR